MLAPPGILPGQKNLSATLANGADVSNKLALALPIDNWHQYVAHTGGRSTSQGS
jgi:hypothetical protein